MTAGSDGRENNDLASRWYKIFVFVNGVLYVRRLEIPWHGEEKGM